jgi:hypothetical protein
MPGAFGWTSGLLQASRPQPEYLCEPILFWLRVMESEVSHLGPLTCFVKGLCNRVAADWSTVISDKNQSGARDVFDLRALTVLFYLLKDRSHGFRKRSYLPHLGLLPSTAWNDHAIVPIDIVPG